MTGANAKIKRIYVGTQLVRPKVPFTPGANTVLYLPMKSDFADKTGNNTMTNTGATITTLSGVSCGYFNGHKLTCSANPLYSYTKTISVWLYVTSLSNNWIIGSNPYGLSRGDVLRIMSSSQSSVSGIYYGTYGGSAGDTRSASRITTSTWQHLCLSGNKLYLNGVDVTSSSGTITTFTQGYPYTIGQQDNGDKAYKGYMSELIVENKIWTESEITKYYNESKSNYGL